MNTQTFYYALHAGDNALILAQRNAEWTGHGPVLEQDIAITNIALDLLGQARNFYQYASSLYNSFTEEQKSAVDLYIPRLWKTYGRELQEDDLAFLRDEHQFLNLLITELPRGDWAHTVLRQFFVSAFQFHLYTQLQVPEDPRLTAISEKSIKEVAYHLRWSSEWVVRLGSGTSESHQRMQNALSDQWMFTGELFEPVFYDLIDPTSLKEPWISKVAAVFSEAGLQVPAQMWAQSGGKLGKHTEHMGFLLAEMQHLQRAYPNSIW